MIATRNQNETWSLAPLFIGIIAPAQPRTEKGRAGGQSSFSTSILDMTWHEKCAFSQLMAFETYSYFCVMDGADRIKVFRGLKSCNCLTDSNLHCGH
jgi:hypothetical protein